MATNNSLNTYIVPTTANEITWPAQPAVLAYNSANDANQTGNGANATIDYDTEVFDQNGDFAADTFTAPVTGRYLISASATTYGQTVATNTIEFYFDTSNRTVRQVLGNSRNSGGSQTIFNTYLADMDAADTVTVALLIGGEAGNTIGIVGSVTLYTYFCCTLVA